MKIKEVIGIDVSKLEIDVCIHTKQTISKFKNTKKGFSQLIKWVSKHTDIEKHETRYIFEHTGMYSHLLSVFLSEKEYPFSIISGLEIKRSLGISRGKDDIIDAKRIAVYGYRLRDELECTELISDNLTQLKNLLTLREKLSKQRASFKKTLHEQQKVYIGTHHKILFEVQKQTIKHLSKQIEKVDAEMEKIVENDASFKKNHDLIVSIKGVGTQTALNMIIITNNFTKFNNWRKFASYCGTAPFPYQSGTSVRGRTKVSNLANKKMKSIINLCAFTAILHNQEMKKYYKKRVDEGKSKMSTINIIRNKLIARIFAVVDRQAPYVNTYKFAV